MHTQSHQSHTVEQIEIGDDLRLFLLPTNVFIPTPFHMEAELLCSFRDRKRQVLLLNRRNRQILLATLDALHDTFLVAYTRQDVFANTQCGDDVIVFFPTMAQHHYILKTRIDRLSCNRFTLHYQDPRADVRWSFPVSLPVLCSLAPPALVGALRYARVAREITGQAEGKPGARIGRVTDLICESNSVATSALMQTFQESRPLSCSLHDISLGGVGLTLEATYDLEEFDHRLVRLQILLPPVTPGSLDQESPGVFLRPLGVIRQFRTTSQTWTLHIQFLAPLPQEFNMYFEEVAQMLGGSHGRVMRVDDLGVMQRDASSI